MDTFYFNTENFRELYPLKEERFRVKNQQLLELAAFSQEQLANSLASRENMLLFFRKIKYSGSFSIIDRATQKLFLFRSASGLSPLFYGVCKEGIIFSSHFDNVFQHPWHKEDKELRLDVVREYFAFGYMQSPNTVFKNIFQVSPGELVIIDKNEKIVKENICVLEKFPKTRTSIDLAEFKMKLKEVIKRTVDNKSKIASFLSGGIDSTLITAFLKEEKEDLTAFTLKVKDITDESKYAADYAEILNVSLKAIEIEEEQVLDLINEHFKAFPEPFGDYSSIPSYFLTKEISKESNTVFSGDGGDEILWGYPRMYDFLKKAWWFKMPFFVRTNLVRIANKFKITNTHAPFAKDLEEFWMKKHLKLPLNLLNGIHDSFSSEMNALYSLNPKWNQTELQQFIRWNEFYGHLQRCLIKVERTSSKNQLEIVIPFLDADIVHYVWEWFSQLDSPDDLKKPLKELFNQYIPENIRMKQKRGFTIPLEQWFRSVLKKDLLETVMNSNIYGNDLFDQEVIRDYVRKFLDEKHNNVWGVWHIYAWQKWAMRYCLIKGEKS